MKDMAIGFLESRNLTATQDLPVFVAVHTALSAILVTSTWMYCYTHSSNHQGLKFIQKRIPPKNIPGKRLATSFVEAKVGRLVVKPITIPARLWLSWKATVAWKNRMWHCDDEEKKR